MDKIKRNEKIAGCKPSLLSARPDFRYQFTFIDKSGAEWEFGLHTLSARQRGAIQASYATVKISSEGKAKQEIESNLELVTTATIMNALDSWNLEDVKIDVASVDMLPMDVRQALSEAIAAHESGNDATMEAELKN